MIKKILLAAALLLPMLASAQTVKIGLVDTQAIVEILPDTQEARNKIADTSKKYEDEYAKLGEEMKRMYDELMNLKEDELPAIRERKTRDFQDYQQKVQLFEQNAMQDLQKLQNDLMAPIYTKVRNAIEAVGKEGGYTLVTDKNPQMVFYYQDPAVDITDAVKAKLNLR